jgi:hypothetical protein
MSDVVRVINSSVFANLTGVSAPHSRVVPALAACGVALACCASATDHECGLAVVCHRECLVVLDNVDEMYAGLALCGLLEVS